MTRIPTPISRRLVVALSTLLLLALVALPNSGVARSQNPDATGNLIPEGDFETDGAGWIVCGGARIVDKQAGATADMVRSGRYALRIGAPANNAADCGNDAIGPYQVAAQDFTVPSDASDLTVSFWHSALGT